MKNISEDYTLLTSALKEILRARGVTYKEVADALEVSEVTIKRLFTSSDGTFSKMAQMCDFLEINMFDLISSINNKAAKSFYFTKKQESFFAANSCYLDFFLEIYQYGTTVKELKKRYGLTDRSIFKYLKKLDELELLELREGNKFKFLVSGDSASISGGRLQQMSIDNSIDFAKHSIKQVINRNMQYQVRLGDLFVSKKTFEDAYIKLGELHQSLVKRAQEDKLLTKKKDLIEIDYLFSLGPSLTDKRAIKNLK